MPNVGLLEILVLAALLIVIGIYGILSRKNLLTVLFATEILFSGINLTFASLSQATGTIQGATFVFFIMAITACETVVMLSLVFVYFRVTQSTSIEKMDQLNG
ncbi:MAG: NADH-quinone oxidoreductase subunit NuoK [bacterium]